MVNLEHRDITPEWRPEYPGPKTLARIYEGYASYINSKNSAFEKIAVESKEWDFDTSLRFFLGFWGGGRIGD